MLMGAAYHSGNQVVTAMMPAACRMVFGCSACILATLQFLNHPNPLNSALEGVAEAWHNTSVNTRHTYMVIADQCHA